MSTFSKQDHTLHAFADNQGVKYVRWAPNDGKDWNDVVIAEQRASEAQEAASAEEVQRDDPTPDSQQEKAPEGTRIGGGRSI